MRVNHLEMALIDRQIDRFADGAARMMHIRAHISELHKVLEILDRAITAAFIEIMHEGRAINRRENRVLAANLHIARRIPRVLGIFGRYG